MNNLKAFNTLFDRYFVKLYHYALKYVRDEHLAEEAESRLIFREATLVEILQTLQRWYNVKISFKKHQKSEERMTVFRAINRGVDH
ncbi:DUF4974 domain-containing protein [Pedobacter hartonius]|uniref:Protein FecR C-terminal domain-containing protein n=1 Tax=Pedobacter hartonius TaxID=425514 RepID=A0A1H4HI14_9SPHI|nr:DUF4974 domain-containing protein [Pedobacter hartonius]SEB21070.1 protein of unknown function [Pedobacter hartonius]